MIDPPWGTNMLGLAGGLGYNRPEADAFGYEYQKMVREQKYDPYPARFISEEAQRLEAARVEQEEKTKKDKRNQLLLLED